MRVSRILGVGATVLALTLSAAACGGPTNNDTGTQSLVDRIRAEKKVTIGIKFDQPGLGLKTGDMYSGFDVDVARYIAGKLGVPEDNITFKQSPSAQREDMIAKGDVDLVIATYTINDQRKAKVGFAGPYFVAGQDLLVRSSNTTITGPDKLNGKKICSVAGSTSAQTIKSKFSTSVGLQQYGGYSECITGLLNGAVDALSTDDIILAGYAAINPGELKVIGKPFTTENYGIGFKRDDTKTRQALNGYIQEMEQDGSWKAALMKNFGAGYKVPQPPAITEK
ncbi:MAG: glutamate ABC transporter substrate-binding protein [Kutzneria sp.]|nr:glutamate ABC transporter substrate-binding protein [Kutzneria sp.]MBV9846020.1 glutamate ABC transporter substrate-binding protein [Kutzneria sp.]